jgi:hypothetical protein
MMTESTDDPGAITIKITQMWVKLSDTDLADYCAARNVFIGILVSEYAFTRQQAEGALSNMERICSRSKYHRIQSAALIPKTKNPYICPYSSENFLPPPL